MSNNTCEWIILFASGRDTFQNETNFAFYNVTEFIFFLGIEDMPIYAAGMVTITPLNETLKLNQSFTGCFQYNASLPNTSGNFDRTCRFFGSSQDPKDLTENKCSAGVKSYFNHALLGSTPGKGGAVPFKLPQSEWHWKQANDIHIKLYLSRTTA